MTRSTGPTRGAVLRRAAVRGMAAGLGGVAVMTLGEKLEQAVTGRANSNVPGRTLRALLGRSPVAAGRLTPWNHAMHWGTGALLGTLRGVWAAVGLRGPAASTAHLVMRLATDQTLENATGVGSPPRTWPRGELVVDVAHKAVYALATGLMADGLIRPTLQAPYGRETTTGPPAGGSRSSSSPPG